MDLASECLPVPERLPSKHLTHRLPWVMHGGVCLMAYSATPMEVGSQALSLEVRAFQMYREELAKRGAGSVP